MQFWRKRTGDLAREFSIIGQINQLSLVCKWDILWGIFIQAECLPNAKAKSWKIKILLIWPWLPCFQAWFWVSAYPREGNGQWPGTDWWFFGTEARNSPAPAPECRSVLGCASRDLWFHQGNAWPSEARSTRPVFSKEGCGKEMWGLFILNFGPILPAFCLLVGFDVYALYDTYLKVDQSSNL